MATKNALKPKMIKESYDIEKSNELIVAPGEQIALSIIRNQNGGVSVIVAEDVFADVDDEAVEKVLDCVRDTIEAARNKTIDNPQIHAEYVN